MQRGEFPALAAFTIGTGASPGPGTADRLYGESIMIGNAASVAYLILAVFLGGVAFGAVVMVAAAVRREDRHFTLSSAAPGAVARGARRLTGFGGSGSHFM